MSIVLYYLFYNTSFYTVHVLHLHYYFLMHHLATGHVERRSGNHVQTPVSV